MTGTPPSSGTLSRQAPRKRQRWGVGAALRPPPKLTLSQWADRHFYLSAESAAEPGRWKTLPYQRGILDAITDPSVVRVSLMKSARVGYTKCVNAAIGYFIHQDPCPILVVQPTVEDAEGYSKEEIAPMLRDCEVLTNLIGNAKPRKRKSGPKESTAKTSGETILAKSFPGGVLSMVGANSGRGLRRVSRRVVIFDEVDGYPASAGNEGDPVKLGERRAEYYWNRKIIAGSTPLVAGASRIEELFNAGDRRRYYVPCPHCGHMDFLRFSERHDDDGAKRGHVMRWPDGPESACFECRSCGCAIEETDKRAMIAAGEWRAEGPFTGHASFHIWAAYSLSPNATWAQLVAEFLEAKNAGPDQLRTFVNTVLGETWKEKGDAPDWELLQLRAESYAIGTVPDGPIVLTAGVDVQKDRFFYEVVGWGPNRESWSVDAGALYGDTALEATWSQLDTLLDRAYPGAVQGVEHRIAMMAVDSGFNTQTVYNWARRHPMSRVIAVKGVGGAARALVGSPSPVDITVRGKKLRRGYKVWPVGVDIAKAELYGYLGLKRGTEAPPPGFCHFPAYGPEFFQQLTAEHLVTTRSKKNGRTKLEWQVQPNRENHHLDTRIYARVAAAVLGIDRLRPSSSTAPSPSPRPSPPPPPGPSPSSAPDPAPGEGDRESFWKRKRRPRGPGGWFAKRR
jgi:phage terminase large subunit GpA-like protein